MEHSLRCSVQWVQLDDQNGESTVHPVVWCPSASAAKRGTEAFLSLAFVRALDVVDAYHIRHVFVRLRVYVWFFG